MAEYAAQPRAARLVSAWGHAGPQLLCGSILLAIGIALLPPPGVLMFSVPVTLMAFVVATWFAMRHHDRRLCEACMATMPLNAAERAIKLRRRFWMAHTGSERRFLIPYLVVLIGSNFAMGDPVGKTFWVLMQSSMIFLILSNTTHRRLQPWCPWCSDGGGGQDKSDDVAPPPLPSDHRQLV
jgi:hypothetical protein